MPSESTMQVMASEWLDQSGCGLEEHISDHGDPVYAAQKREILGKASPEARALIMIILNAPGEVMRLFGREKNTTMRQLHVTSIVVKGGKTYHEACEIMDEVRDIVREIF
jgi:hypothetical protein